MTKQIVTNKMIEAMKSDLDDSSTVSSKARAVIGKYVLTLTLARAKPKKAKKKAS